jgi:exopolysaccharide production protein ExoQ
MNHAASARGQSTILTVCPNALLASVAFVALFFVSWLGAMGALLFLVAGASLFLRAPEATFGSLLDYWPILLLPLWCVLTLMWSAHPDLSLRYGVQLGLTVAIGIAMATRLSPGALLKALFFAGLAAALASVAFGNARADGAGYTGIYASKNDFGFSMVVFLCSATALALGRDTGRKLRLLGLGAMGLAFVLIVMANSVGWLAAGSGLVAVGTGIALLRIVSLPLRLMSIVVTLLAMAALAQYAVIRSEAFLEFFTETTGKDPTLTGRTYLWARALDEIAEAPFVGQGYGAWWVRGNPMAEQLWLEFGKTGRTGFHFHNTWLSNWVEIGAVGVAIQIAIFGRALAGSFRRALVTPRAEALFFAMLMVTMTVMSIGEVVAFMQFHTATVLIVAAAVFAGRARREARLPGDAPSPRVIRPRRVPGSPPA